MGGARSGGNETMHSNRVEREAVRWPNWVMCETQRLTVVLLPACTFGGAWPTLLAASSNLHPKCDPSGFTTYRHHHHHQPSYTPHPPCSRFRILATFAFHPITTYRLLHFNKRLLVCIKATSISTLHQPTTVPKSARTLPFPNPSTFLHTVPSFFQPRHVLPVSPRPSLPLPTPHPHHHRRMPERD